MINYIELSGYKSLAKQQRVSLAGLTVLAGANSSGKSSIMQPLLLLKQTLECPYDAGAILLDGPNVKITASDQALSRIKGDAPTGTFRLGVGTKYGDSVLSYRRGPNGSFKIEAQEIKRKGSEKWLIMKEGVSFSTMEASAFSEGEKPLIPKELLASFTDNKSSFSFSATRDRCFLSLGLSRKSKDGEQPIGINFGATGDLPFVLKRLLHVPGLRGNPERDYRATEVSNQFPGTYEAYVASILWKWQNDGDSRISDVGDQLRLLGLTWKVVARKIQDTRVELRVGRLPRAAQGGAKDLVSLADVGLGVAQVLPILVALLSAVREQIVYIEQPELHLHPRAQWRMAEIIRDAVNRGVRVIIETHSSGLLRGIQTQVALSKMKNSDVSFNWFRREVGTGTTVIDSVTLDKSGAFGDWPADFDDVGLEVEGAYLDAVTV